MKNSFIMKKIFLISTLLLLFISNSKGQCTLDFRPSGMQFNSTTGLLEFNLYGCLDTKGNWYIWVKGLKEFQGRGKVGDRVSRIIPPNPKCSYLLECGAKGDASGAIEVRDGCVVVIQGCGQL